MSLDPLLLWIAGSGLLMSAIALVGSVTLVLSERALQRILLPLVAFAAGSLLGGAFFHMLPVGFAASDLIERASRPTQLAMRGASIKGVQPSPSETSATPGATGMNAR